jgi:hypothetical protein
MLWRGSKALTYHQDSRHALFVHLYRQAAYQARFLISVPFGGPGLKDYVDLAHCQDVRMDHGQHVSCLLKEHAQVIKLK